jgi:hypothetical protein
MGEGKEGILEPRDEGPAEDWRAANEGGRPGPVWEGRDEERAPARGLPIPSRGAGMAPASAADRGPGICSGPPATAAGVSDTCTAWLTKLRRYSSCSFTSLFSVVSNSTLAP